MSVLNGYVIHVFTLFRDHLQTDNERHGVDDAFSGIILTLEASTLQTILEPGLVGQFSESQTFNQKLPNTDAAGEDVEQDPGNENEDNDGTGGSESSANNWNWKFLATTVFLAISTFVLWPKIVKPITKTMKGGV